MTRSFSGRARTARVGLLTASLAVAGVSTLAGPTSPASSAVTEDCPAAYPVDDVTAGQDVTGLTVSSGKTPEGFEGKVLGVLEDGIAPGIDMIMVRLTSDEIDRVGGIWAGMSGSPVYVGDQLLGAVAYGLAGNTPVAGVTPAADMQELLADDAPVLQRARTVSLPRSMQRTLVASGDATARQADQGARQLPTPVFVSGMGKANHLNKAAKRLGIDGTRFFRSAGGRASADPVSPEDAGLVPGGNLGSSLSYGDFSAVGIGTVTMVCGDQVVGFGHPMQWSGDTTMTMHGADALYIQEDPTWVPFKVANPTGPAGTISQDRLQGIAGPLGQLPDTTEIVSDATSADTGKNREGTTYGSVQEFLPDIAALAVVANQSVVLNQAGEGSSAQTFTIEGTDGDGTPFSLTRDNKSVSRWDIAYMSPEELYYTVNLLQNNGFTDVDIDSITMDSTLSEDLEQYKIGTVEYRRAGEWRKASRRNGIPAVAGSILKLRVGLVPDSEGLDPATTTLNVPIPADARREGSLNLGSGDAYVSKRELKPSSFADLVSKIEDRAQADQVVAGTNFRRSGRQASVASAAQSAVVNGYRWYPIYLDGAGGDGGFCRGC